MFVYYALTCSVECFICSVASCSLGSSVLVCRSHWCVYFQILFNIMDIYEWKLSLSWSCKWIICKRITKHTCWSVGMWLTHHIKFCTCKNSILNTAMYGHVQVQSCAIHWQACYMWSFFFCLQLLNDLL